MLEGGDRLLGRVHWHQGGDREPVAIGPVLLGHELVVSAAQDDSLLIVQQLQEGDAHRRIEDCEIDAGLLEPVVVALRGGDRGVVLGARWNVPGVRKDTGPAPLLHGEILDVALPVQHPFEEGAVAVVPYVVEEDGEDLDDVAVAIDHGVVELMAQLF